jgi:hypothetical protein
MIITSAEPLPQDLLVGGIPCLRVRLLQEFPAGAASPYQVLGVEIHADGEAPAVQGGARGSAHREGIEHGEGRRGY